MGIDAYTLGFIRDLGPPLPGARALMLGRQAVNRAVEHPKVAAFARALEPGAADWPEKPRSPEFLERLMGVMGYAVETLDISPYQGAGILHDLGRPVPEALHGRFDLIYDGGTTEHIFNLPTAFANIARMLRPGGVFVTANLMNGGPTHGLYQFSPELVWSYWKRALGWEVLACRALPVQDAERHPPFDLPDTGAEGRRPRILQALPRGWTFLFAAVRKTGEPPEGELRAFQGDYLSRWAARQAEDEGEE